MQFLARIRGHFGSRFAVSVASFVMAGLGPVSAAGDPSIHSGIRHVAVSIPPGVSWYLPAMKAGIPVDVLMNMFHIFEYKVDFQRSFESGRSFEVYYDAKDGTIRYSMMSVSGDKIAFYRYQPNPNSAAVYFDATGRSANGKIVLSGAELRAFLDARRNIRATVAAAPLNNSN